MELFEREKQREKAREITRKLSVLKEEETRWSDEIQDLEVQILQKKKECKHRKLSGQLDELQQQKKQLQNELNELVVRRQKTHFHLLQLHNQFERLRTRITDLQDQLGSPLGNYSTKSQKEMKRQLEKVNSELEKEQKRQTELRAMLSVLTEQRNSSVVTRLHQEEEELTNLESVLSVIERDLNMCSVEHLLNYPIDPSEKDRSRAISATA